jgi:anti-sigma28 factor (negative regulator of flagellin synthesis)
MKINAGQPDPTLNGIGKKAKAGGTDRPCETESMGKKTFSELVSIHGARLRECTVQTSRQARLQNVHERIGNGIYAPDSKAVARGLLKSVATSGNLLSTTIPASL